MCATSAKEHGEDCDRSDHGGFRYKERIKEQLRALVTKSLISAPTRSNQWTIPWWYDRLRRRSPQANSSEASCSAAREMGKR